jgi:predicted RNA-binding Zn-ribbon protein involved in translation (DUF1610 family)
MLTIKCAKCKSKIIKYKKIGKGKVLRCWKDRITRVYEGKEKDNNLVCRECGNSLGELSKNNRGKYYKMNRDEFTYTGNKIKK